MRAGKKIGQNRELGAIYVCHDFTFFATDASFNHAPSLTCRRHRSLNKPARLPCSARIANLALAANILDLTADFNEYSANETFLV